MYVVNVRTLGLTCVKARICCACFILYVCSCSWVNNCVLACTGVGSFRPECTSLTLLTMSWFYDIPVCWEDIRYTSCHQCTLEPEHHTPRSQYQNDMFPLSLGCFLTYREHEAAFSRVQWSSVVQVPSERSNKVIPIKPLVVIWNFVYSHSLEVLIYLRTRRRTLIWVNVTWISLRWHKLV